jgi:hypothetical protein
VAIPPIGSRERAKTEKENTAEKREKLFPKRKQTEMKGKTEHSKYLRHESEEEEKKKNEKIEIWR